MFVALLAAITMIATDILGVIMVMAESNERGWLAGWMDTAQWLVGIVTTTISVSALQGHSLDEKIWVVALVSAANLFGTKLGQIIGSKLMSSMKVRTMLSRGALPTPTLKERVAALESYVNR